MNAYIHTYIQTNKHTYHTHIPYIHTIHTYIHTYITPHHTTLHYTTLHYITLHTYHTLPYHMIPTSVHTSMHACMHASIHTYIHTQTYITIYIYIYTTYSSKKNFSLTQPCSAVRTPKVCTTHLAWTSMRMRRTSGAPIPCGLIHDPTLRMGR